MKKEIAYYNDSYQKTIQSKVIDCIKSKKGYDIVLEDTCFYPEGGGQPADKGILYGQQVLDVQERNDTIYHTVKNEIPIGTLVEGEIDWEYRFDLMQNHTAEHILSGIVYRKYGLHNVGFHMGKDVITLDFDGKLSQQQIIELEQCANEAVMQNKTIRIYYPTKQELQELDYRSKKSLEGVVRIVEIPGYDICACCGIHTKTTGEIGSIKIIQYDSYKGGIRLQMIAAKRALKDYSEKSQSAYEISHLLSVTVKDISKAVEKLKKEKDTLQWQINFLEKQRLEQIVDKVKNDTKKAVFFEKVLNHKTLQYFATMLCEKVNIVAVFSGEEQTGYTYILMSHKEDMKQLKQILSAVYPCNGGGTKEMVQGKIQAKKEEIIQFFEKNIV